MLRTRNRTTIGSFTDPLSPTVLTAEVRDFMMDDASNFKSHKPCLHYKHKTPAVGFAPNQAFLSGITDSGVTLALLTRLNANLETLRAPQPKFIRNNQFDLLPFLLN